MNIENNDYNVYYDPEKSTVFLAGFLRLNGIEAYQPIMDLLLTAVATCDDFTVDLSELEFLNSSGISMLSMFVVKIRDTTHKKYTFIGSNKILWQTRSLKNLGRLMPDLAIHFV